MTVVSLIFWAPLVNSVPVYRRLESLTLESYPSLRRTAQTAASVRDCTPILS